MAALAVVAAPVAASMQDLAAAPPRSGATDSPTESARYRPPHPAHVGFPEYTLELRSVGDDADRPVDRYGVLASLGVNADRVSRFENFAGLGVWSGTGLNGMTCLFIAVPVQGLREGLGAEACSPEGFQTVAELVDYPSTQSLVRFVLRESRVDVYFYEQTPDPRQQRG